MSKKPPRDNSNNIPKDYLDRRLMYGEHTSKPVEKKGTFAKIFSAVLPKLGEQSKAKEAEAKANKERVDALKQKAEASKRQAKEKAEAKKAEQRVQKEKYKEEIAQKKAQALAQKEKSKLAVKQRVEKSRAKKQNKQSGIELEWDSEDLAASNHAASQIAASQQKVGRIQYSQEFDIDEPEHSEVSSNASSMSVDENLEITLPSKRVTIDESRNTVEETYSADEYERVDPFFALTRHAGGKIGQDLTFMRSQFESAYRKISQRMREFPEATMEEILSSFWNGFALGSLEDKQNSPEEDQPSKLSYEKKFDLIVKEKFSLEEVMTVIAISFALNNFMMANKNFTQNTIVPKNERALIIKSMESLYKKLEEIETPSSQPQQPKEKASPLKSKTDEPLLEV